MLEKDSYVIYGGNGVCRIQDIRSEKMYGTQQTYYILSPVNSFDSVIYVPADNETLLKRMRAIPGREEILQILEDSREEALPWESDNRQRLEQFEAILNRCDPKELLMLIRTIRKKRTDLAQQNKKLAAMDDSVLKRAEKFIYGTFSFSLSLLPEEVAAMIGNALF